MEPHPHRRYDTERRLGRPRAGELQGLTGIDAPYEAPERPELTLGTLGDTVDDAVAAIIEALR